MKPILGVGGGVPPWMVPTQQPLHRPSLQALNLSTLKPSSSVKWGFCPDDCLSPCGKWVGSRVEKLTKLQHDFEKSWP